MLVLILPLFPSLFWLHYSGSHGSVECPELEGIIESNSGLSAKDSSLAELEIFLEIAIPNCVHSQSTL